MHGLIFKKGGKWYSEFKSHPKHFLSGLVNQDLPQGRNWCLEIWCFLCMAPFQVLFTLFQNLSWVSLCWTFALLLACIWNIPCVLHYLLGYSRTVVFIINDSFTNGISGLCLQIVCTQIAEASNGFITLKYKQFFI